MSGQGDSLSRCLKILIFMHHCSHGRDCRRVCYSHVICGVDWTQETFPCRKPYRQCILPGTSSTCMSFRWQMTSFLIWTEPGWVFSPSCKFNHRVKHILQISSIIPQAFKWWRCSIMSYFNTKWMSEYETKIKVQSKSMMILLWFPIQDFQDLLMMRPNANIIAFRYT